MRMLLVMPAEKIAAEIVLEIAQHGVDMVTVALRVVVFDKDARAV